MDRPKPIPACEAKHTAFQVTDEEWRCPNCKADHDHFYIEEGFGHEDCPALHEEDYIVCTKCHGSWDGKKLAVIFEKKLNVCVCPTCKGTGVVPKTSIKDK